VTGLKVPGTAVVAVVADATLGAATAGVAALVGAAETQDRARSRPEIQNRRPALNRFMMHSLHRLVL
jgi:hypothetical protein